MFISAATPISWTSKEHNLVLKAPKVGHTAGGCCGGHSHSHAADASHSPGQVDIQELEENDEFTGPGSFFNIFSATGEDVEGLGETLLEWWAHALEYSAGLQPPEESDADFDSDEFESEDDSDLNGEIDLESEGEQPAKKKSRK